MNSNDADRVDLAAAAAEVIAAFHKDPQRVVVLAGATASGKTELGLRVAEALGGAIVNADSVQIVRHFELGSGKPNADERRRAPHHLFDAVEPLEAIDAAEYAARALAAIEQVRAGGQVPIVVGGTFLWVRALVWGLAEMPPADPELRARHEALVRAQGATALHEALRAVDPEAAARLHPNDVLRVSRALEVFAGSGKPQSAHFAEHGFRSMRLPSLVFALAQAPSVLDARIESRVQQWLDAGWVAEVEALHARGFGAARAMGAVGFKEIAAHLRGELPREELQPSIVRATRVYARRQRTWLRGTHDVHWLGHPAGR